MPAAEVEEEATYEMVDAPAAAIEAEPEQAAPPAQHVVPVEDVVIVTSQEELEQALAQQQPQEAAVKKGAALQAHPLPALQDIQWEACACLLRPCLHAYMQGIACSMTRFPKCTALQASHEK